MEEAVTTLVTATTKTPVAQYLWIGLVAVLIGLIIWLIASGRITEFGKLKFKERLDNHSLQVSTNLKNVIQESTDYINSVGSTFREKMGDWNPNASEMEIYKLSVVVREKIQNFVLYNNMDNSDKYYKFRWGSLKVMLEASHLNYDETFLKQMWRDMLEYIVAVKERNEA